MEQSSLGRKEVHNTPSYGANKDIARVVDTTDFDKYGIIDVVYIDGSNAARVWVTNPIDREPVTGDLILVGYISGQKNAPYLSGFIEESYMRNFVQIKKDLIRIQLPVMEIGVVEGISHKDTQEKLLNDDYRGKRALMELTPEHFYIQFPTEDGSEVAFIEILPTGRIIVQSAKGAGIDLDPK